MKNNVIFIIGIIVVSLSGMLLAYGLIKYFKHGMPFFNNAVILGIVAYLGVLALYVPLIMSNKNLSPSKRYQWILIISLIPYFGFGLYNSKFILQ